MGNSPRCLGLILARGGSKGIPQKNIATLCGKPLIAWALEAAKKSNGLDRLLVSTDCDVIRKIALAYGAEVPFLRPAFLATDSSPAIDAALHVLDWLKIESYQPDYLVLLQATSPLTTESDILAAIALAKRNKADAVVSLNKASRSPYKMKRIDSEGKVATFLGEGDNKNRQELPSVYDVNGSIFLIRPEVLRREKTFFPKNTFAYEMPQERSLDIDTPWDLTLAEKILSFHQSGHSHSTSCTNRD